MVGRAIQEESQGSGEHKLGQKASQKGLGKFPTLCLESDWQYNQTFHPIEQRRKGDFWFQSAVLTRLRDVTENKKEMKQSEEND